MYTNGRSKMTGAAISFIRFALFLAEIKANNQMFDETFYLENASQSNRTNR